MPFFAYPYGDNSEGAMTVADDSRLHPLVLRDLQGVHRELLANGELRSREELQHYYRTFRERFGPDALMAHDGEALLSLMHETTPDGMIYWLEFKNDDEFPAIFGSIAGGSALKYGFYRRQETREWTAGPPKAQRTITTADAVARARRNRDQLVAASELLARLPPDASSEAYAELQKELERVAGEVQDSAWGHKYLSLIHPDKLDDYHVVSHQRFHLAKLLQEPSTQEGRYVNAARFVSLSRALQWPLNQVTTVLNRRDGQPHRYWRVGTRAGDNGTSYWDRMRQESIVSVGWPKLGDISKMLAYEKFTEAVKDRLATLYPAAPPVTGRAAHQLRNFCKRLCLQGPPENSRDGVKVLVLGADTTIA